ncbi:MAG: VOC family protein [Candidatus Omnitrophica bacterium]|nr:VOC family protein [Candidatus Omnitrophota bacterium]
MAILVFSHMGLTCKDPVEIEKFYSKYFGFKRARVYAPGPEQVVMIKSGNIYLELFKAGEESTLAPAKEAGPNYPGWKHICFMVDNLDALLKEIGGGARITLGPLDMGKFIPGMKVCWIADPEGNIVELNQGYVDE